MNIEIREYETHGDDLSDLCFFCGEESVVVKIANFENEYKVCCVYCGTETKPYSKKTEAIEYWNDRGQDITIDRHTKIRNIVVCDCGCKDFGYITKPDSVTRYKTFALRCKGCQTYGHFYEFIEEAQVNWENAVKKSYICNSSNMCLQEWKAYFKVYIKQSESLLCKMQVLRRSFKLLCISGRSCRRLEYKVRACRGLWIHC